MRAVLIFCLALFAALPVSAGPFITPDEIRPGMKGYGLTVFKGTDPESFSVEAVGVLKNAFPKQDMVLILCDDPKLEVSNVVAGMSGSPIYFDNRLLGALAYGWTFEKRPLAGVTPIGNMLEELDRPLEPTVPWDSARRPDDAGGMESGGMVPVAAPLALGGFSMANYPFIEKHMSKFGMIPVAAGGSASGEPAPPRPFKPGSAIGVTLMRGDLDMTAIGTVTYVADDGRVLAFGHPAFNFGRTSFPAATAQVHTFMASVARSFKLSSPVAPAGAMVQDRQPAILVDPAGRAGMIPVSIDVSNAVTGQSRRYDFEIVRNKQLTPFLAAIGLLETLGASEAGSFQTYELETRVKFKDISEPLVLTDYTLTPMFMIIDLWQLFMTHRFQFVPESISHKVTVTSDFQFAEITGAQIEQASARPGDIVPVRVTLGRPDGGSETVIVPVRLPDDLEGPAVGLQIGGGLNFREHPQPEPRRAEQVLAAVRSRAKGNEIVARIMRQSAAHVVGGTALPDVPMFFSTLLQRGVLSPEKPVAWFPDQRYPVKRVVIGQAQIAIKLEGPGLQ